MRSVRPRSGTVFSRFGSVARAVEAGQNAIDLCARRRIFYVMATCLFLFIR